MSRSRTLHIVLEPGKPAEAITVDLRDPSDADYYTKGKAAPPAWPEHDPPPEVTSGDPRPADAPAEPKAVKDLKALGIISGHEVRVGYSRGLVRTKSVGVYKRLQVFGVWAGAHPNTGWRFAAMYAHSPDLKGLWKWESTAIWRADGERVAPGLGTRFVDATVTDLKEWLSTGGAPSPAWLKGVHARVQEQAARVKARPATKVRKEGAS